MSRPSSAYYYMQVIRRRPRTTGIESRLFSLQSPFSLPNPLNVILKLPMLKLVRAFPRAFTEDMNIVVSNSDGDVAASQRPRSALVLGTKDKMRRPRIPCFQIPVSDGRKLTTKSRNAKNRLQVILLPVYWLRVNTTDVHGWRRKATPGSNSGMGQWLC